MTVLLRFVAKACAAVAVWVWLSERFAGVNDAVERLALTVEDTHTVWWPTSPDPLRTAGGR